MAKLPVLSKLKECPHCGAMEYYTKNQTKGYIIFRSSLDGSEVSNENMYEHLNIKTGSFVFCGECHKKIAQNDINENKDKI
ncbi:hypothetical protein [Aquamicrobium sp.]|uniref:hypothetical protein n=1 Tax=Aquamicrobium sp. TaxID=1872579 RepID=UPI00258D9801|nr:hypothetical protein [Aquamicrobium sp.]MCK9549304.1 hypothetical protein [Aquamicrobium sp.]